MITCDYQSLCIVKDEGFIEYSILFQLHYKISNIGHVSVTIDIWASDSNRGYISVTLHFVLNNKFHKFTTEEIIGSHTGELISTLLSDIFVR